MHGLLPIITSKQRARSLYHIQPMRDQQITTSDTLTQNHHIAANDLLAENQDIAEGILKCCIDEIKQLNQVEKLIGKRLHEEKSDWPMEVTTPTPPRVREPRPAKVDRMGNAVQERRKAVIPAARAARSRPKAASGRVVIGRDGQIRQGTGKPVRRINRQKHRG